MKRFVFLLLFLGTSLSGIAQEKYFHELRGMEDSTGTTHLFYRMYESSIYTTTCNTNEESFKSSRNDIYHINLAENTDTVLFVDYYSSGGCTGIDYSNTVLSYQFFEQNPDHWIRFTLAGCGGFGIDDYLGRETSLLLGCIIKQNPAYNYDISKNLEMILGHKNDSLYVNYYNQLITYSVADSISPNHGELAGEELANFFDTLKPSISAIHPHVDSIFYQQNDNGHLLISETYSSGFQLADDQGSTSYMAFDSDSSIVYSINTIEDNGVYYRRLKRSSNLGKLGSWSVLELPHTFERLDKISTDSKAPGNVYIMNSNQIYSSKDYGNTFSLVFESELTIRDIYKKPDSNILYVLTTDELLELNIETLETTQLKALPVSNETDPELPNSIKLYQNYPNPFNPSTIIPFELSWNTEVKLTVFDLLGRTIAVLLDEPRSAGSHEVSFDASALSSGIYFYRLETDNTQQTRKLMVIK